MFKIYFKCFFDFISALALLLIFSPIILATFILLLFNNNGSVFFFQVRPGYQSKPFVNYKFKTM